MYFFVIMLPCRVETRGGDSAVGSGVRGAGWKGVITLRSSRNLDCLGWMG